MKQSRLRVSLALAVLWTAWTVTACRDPNKTDDGPAADASRADAAVLGASTEPAVVPTTARPPDDGGDHEGVDLHSEDGGRDGGRRRRRLAAPGLDAAVETAPAAAPPSAEATERPRGKSTSTMVDDQPFGGAGASSAPALKKKPLPVDDPWAKSPAPPSP